MGSDSDKVSRLNQRNFGVTNRIWLIVSFFLFIFIFTHFALPTTHEPPRNPYSPATNLRPKNYLNATSTEPNPFAFCPAYNPGDELGRKYGAQVLSKSRMHLGSSDRIQQVLNRALAGLPVTISVIGGSVSACHGAGDDPISPRCYPSMFFHWWNSVFPHPATELTNGAMRRTNSGYFGFCSAHHLPDVTDLVIIELDSEDTPDDEKMMENFETLVRSILLRPDHPAIILLGHFSPQVHQTYGFAGPDHWHSVVAQFYDIPYISIKSALFPLYMKDQSAISKYFVDPVLSSPLGHELITDILVAYLQSQICTAWAIATGASFDSVPVHSVDSPQGDTHGLFGGVGQRKGVPEPDQKGGNTPNKDGTDTEGNRVRPDPAVNHPPVNFATHVPPGRINTRPGGRHFEEIAPYCVSANDLINPLPPSLFYGSGWLSFHSSSGAGGALRVTSHYWYSSLPTSKLRIPLQVGAGDIGIYYLEEPINVIGEGSAVECWVDDNYGGAKIIENAKDIGEPTPKLMMIDEHVTRGSHFVECSLLGEEGQSVPIFKIIGIFST